MPVNRYAAALVAIVAVTAALPAGAQLLDILKAPKTLVDRAIEARKGEDIVKDNQIVLKVNKLMAELTTIKASTEIYEQRLLVTGIFEDKALYDKFHAGVKKIEGVKQLYWHVRYMPEAEKKAREKEMIDWKDALVLDAKAGLSLVETRGVADVNYRVAVDAFSAVYLIGRARSDEELKKALSAVRGTEGVKKVVNYVEVRP